MSVVELEPKSRRPLIIFVSAGAIFAFIILYVALAIGHSDNYRLVKRGSEVVLEKGIFAPFGYSQYDQIAAYQPVEVPVDLEFEDRDCADLSDCERILFGLIIDLIYHHLSSRTPEDLERAKELMVRAQLFPHLGWDERERIQDFSGGIYYTESLVMMEVIYGDYKRILKKLYRARASIEFVEVDQIDAKIRFVEEQLQLLEQQGIGIPIDSTPIPAEEVPEPSIKEETEDHESMGPW